MLTIVCSEDKAPPPGVMVAARAQIDDPNDEAQYGDRIKYLMPRPNHPGERLVELATAPLEYMEQGMHLHTDYYIDRMLIRPLDRVFRLVGVDIRRWYNEMPKTRKVWRSDVRNTSNRDKIVGHFHSAQCLSCQHSGMLIEGALTNNGSDLLSSQYAFSRPLRSVSQRPTAYTPPSRTPASCS